MRRAVCTKGRDVSTNRYGIAAGNNLGLTPSNGFSGFVADNSGGLRLFNTTLALYNGTVLTGRWSPNGQLDIGFDVVDIINDRDFTVNMSGYIRLGRGTTNYPNLFYSKTGEYMAWRSGTTDKIRFNNDGSSFFSGIMEIGTAGEIRQGTVTSGTLRSAWPLTGYTGLRIWICSYLRLSNCLIRLCQWLFHQLS